jgi:hypothetical protein
VLSRLYLRSIPRRLKRLWMRVLGIPAYQCEGCLWFFDRWSGLRTPCCDGGRGKPFMCHWCLAAGKVPSCYCGC